MSIIGLKAFAEMLNVVCADEMDEEAMIEVNRSIQVKLNSGIIVSKIVQYFTPLMLYSTHHVLDHRFDEALETATSHTNLRGNNVSTSQRVNALSCAVSARNIMAVEKLLATNKFTDSEDYEVALELVALLNFAEAIPVFTKHGCELFTYDWLSRMTPLMHACSLGRIDVVRKILLTNPSEEQLNIASAMENETASSLALKTGDQELTALFSTKIAQKKMNQDKIIQAIKIANIGKIQAVIQDTPATTNLLIVKIMVIF